MTLTSNWEISQKYMEWYCVWISSVKFIISVPDECQMFFVSKSSHSLYSGSTNCFITTSYPLELEALCNKATFMLPEAFSMNSRSGGPSWDSSITLLTKSSLLPMGGERAAGVHNEHVMVKDFVIAPRLNVMDAPAFARFQVSDSSSILPLK